MSIWVQFRYAPASPGQPVEEKYASAQAMAFLDHEEAEHKEWGVYAPFVAEYLAHLEGAPEQDPEESDGCGLYWLEGSTPFRPEALLEWATSWRQLLDHPSPEELDEMLWGCADEWAVEQWRHDMDEFQQFARQAMADGVLLTMMVA